ncbi:P-loop containing nucleoside triphosphate hydrolase [Phytophthora cactorum]|nr:P-loop containing nucleoside triphosphate hydrolase [Phytophthora cactorum]
MARSISAVSTKTDISSTELRYYVVGLIGACVGGILTPASALLVAEMITSMTGKFGLYEDSGDRKYLSELYDRVQLCGILYLVGAAAILLFTYMQTQNVGFFDEKENATGALTADLATNAVKLAAFTDPVSDSTAAGLWDLGSHERDGGDSLISDDLAVPGAHASEVLGNIRTVAALGLEQKSVNTFDELLEEPLRKGNKEAQATYAFIFWFGAKKVNDGTISVSDMMRTLMAIMMSIQAAGSASKVFGDAPKAFKAGSTIFAIRDRVVPIDSFDPDGLRLAKVNVLKHYNLTIEAGQTVAFCGPSGGGKSTIISLIERFYDPVAGEVLLDGHNIKDLNLNWLRDNVGLPSQQEIEEAAKMANAHGFIAKFPDGYDTQVAMKGEHHQCSGLESEKVVQEALDKVVALKRRTTIIIAHRLSTIRNADKICVVNGGKIAEQGAHQELLQLNGIYAGLVASASS